MADADMTQSEFADLVGSKQPTVSRWLQGIRPDPEYADAIDRLWKAAHPDDGPNVRMREVPVYGKIGAGAEVMPEYEQVPPEGLFLIEFGFATGRTDIAFQIEGDSMWPRYDDGDIVVCTLRGDQPDRLIGREAAVRTADGRRYIKRIRRGSELGLFNLESHNASPIEDVEIAWASEITHVARRNQWDRM